VHNRTKFDVRITSAFLLIATEIADIKPRRRRARTTFDDATPQTRRKCVRLAPKRCSRGFLECLVDVARNRFGAFRRRLLPERAQLLGLFG
jgi:hypothetical protein